MINFTRFLTTPKMFFTKSVEWREYFKTPHPHKKKFLFFKLMAARMALAMLVRARFGNIVHVTCCQACSREVVPRMYGTTATCQAHQIS